MAEHLHGYPRCDTAAGSSCTSSDLHFEECKNHGAIRSCEASVVDGIPTGQYRCQHADAAAKSSRAKAAAKPKSKPAKAARKKPAARSKTAARKPAKPKKAAKKKAAPKKKAGKKKSGARKKK